MSNMQADIIIVGAGLSGLLTAWRCLAVNPGLSVTLIEGSGRIGGDHTWSFNWSDLIPEVQAWAKDFAVYQWDKYNVKFPKRDRQLDIKYCTGNSDSLRKCVQPFIDNERLKVMLNSQVTETSAIHVTLKNGEVLKTGWVLDARGFEPKDTVYLGYQKFVGRTIKTKEPHGLKYPIIMDATVDQLDGYRFVYCLPFTEHEVLVEDTYYTDGAELSENELVARLDNYITANGWEEHELVRQEKGVLPITLAIDSARFEEWAHESGRATPIGIRGGYYHAVTGYSLPQAMKSAWLIADQIKKADGKLAAAQAEMDQHEYDHYREEKFLRLLNRMLFRAAKPENRYKVLQRFYGLSEPLIERFYAGQYTRKDQLRILAGKPPVPIHKALKNFKEADFISREKAKQKEQA